MLKPDGAEGALKGVAAVKSDDANRQDIPDSVNRLPEQFHHRCVEILAALSELEMTEMQNQEKTDDDAGVDHGGCGNAPFPFAVLDSVSLRARLAILERHRNSQQHVQQQQHEKPDFHRDDEGAFYEMFRVVVKGFRTGVEEEVPVQVHEQEPTPT